MNVLAAIGAHAADRLEAEQRAWGFDPAQDVGVAGDAATVADAVRRWADAGADTVVLQPTSDEPDVEGFLRFAGGEVQPLVRWRIAPPSNAAEQRRRGCHDPRTRPPAEQRLTS